MITSCIRMACRARTGAVPACTAYHFSLTGLVKTPILCSLRGMATARSKMQFQFVS